MRAFIDRDGFRWVYTPGANSAFDGDGSSSKKSDDAVVGTDKFGNVITQTPGGDGIFGNTDDLITVACLQCAVEDDEDVAGRASLLDDAVAVGTLDDVAAPEAALDLVVGERVEDRDLLRLDLVHGPWRCRK